MRQVATGSRIPPLVGLLATMLVSGCAEPGPTVEEARAFVDDAEARLLEVWIDAARAGWVQSNFITDDTTAIAASAQTVVIGATMELATEAARFDGVALPEETRRKLLLLKTSMGLAAPADPALQAELAGITTSMESTYGRGVYCPGDGEDCLDLPQMERLFAESRDTDELLDLWTGWRTISPPLRSPYVRFTELANAGARDLGFTDLGELWRAG
ncbi:MAG TPA: peptidase M2 family protein, partial [Acidobacteria bacterium]|nr:peptidase M2 family protein [Acidobacteriota bacterium]